VFENIREMWARAEAGSRAALVVGIVVILVGMGYFGYLALRSDYQVLFADLEARDEAAILAELDRMKVPYILGPDGTSILVASDQVHATRIRLMGKGVNLQGGVGFELFNNTDFGMTEFAQKINYQRALQGELARTIMAMEEVKYARVHLVLPESGILKRSQQTPKASISLAMRDGRTLAPAQVLGIQRLVAAAVPEIRPSGVTIVDQRGVALTRPNDSGDEESGAAYRMTVKGDIEKELTAKVVAVLDRAFGPGKAIVSVDVTVNTDQVRITREDVLPQGRQGAEATGVVTRRRSTARGGVQKDDSDSGSTTEVEYQTGRRVEQIVSRPGSIGRLSVGVLLPRDLDASQLKSLRQLISMAVGLNPARGDEIAISTVEGFSAAKAMPGESAPETMVAPPSRAPSEPAEKAPRDPWDSDLTIATIAVVVMIALLIAALAAISARSRTRGRRRPAPLDPVAREQVLAEMREWLRTGEPLAGGDRKA
jgi:flagellar M-ring protein FliF